MRIKFVILLVVAVYFIFSPLSFAQSGSFEENPQSVSSSPHADEQFDFDLYSQLASSKGNVFFSPYSISTALEMVFEGARGTTAQEMSSVLHLNPDNALRWAEVSAFIQKINSPNKMYELSVANALWAQKTYPFKSDYLSLIKNTYFAQAQNLDFGFAPEASRQTINDWGSDKTKNRITDLLPPGSVTPDTRLVLTDAVYFKGKWEVPFKKEDTRPDTFWLSADQSVQTDMMILSGESFNYAENDQAQVLQLPYHGSDFFMLIILPRSKDIQGLEKSLTQKLLKQWQDAMTSQKVDIYLPKFKFDSAFEMSSILKGMGIKQAFDLYNADFSGMADKIPGKNLFISGVFHKAWIDTNEEGTEAAAATGVAMESMAMAVDLPEPKIFRADHPFIFVIEDNSTGHILFMGRVSDPRENNQ